MTKNQIATAAVLILILLGIGGYFFLNKNGASSIQNVTMPDTVEKTGPKSFADLMKMTVSQTCTFKDETGGSGTTYIGGGKFRADMTAKAQSKVTNAHIISDGSYMYMWNDDEKEGFKMPLDKMTKYSADANSQGSSSKSVDIEKKVDVDCKGWSVDNSKFAVPTGIKFQDFGAMMEAMPDAMTNPGTAPDSAQQCAACDSLPAEGATQCKKALNCN